jgi:hypothetical protein
LSPKFLVFDADGNEVELPCHYVVCGRCNGTGVHDHPAFSNGLSREDFDEDPDFAEEYFRGTYDVRCSVCEGERVVSAPNEEQLTPEQKDWLKWHYESLAEAAAERRMRERGIEF